MKVGRVVFNPQTFDAGATCGKGFHAYKQGSEICVCGKKPKHEICRCGKCGDTHWKPRNIYPIDEKRGS